MSITAKRLILNFSGDAGLLTWTPSITLGAELLANADFSTWAADNPASWMVQNESGSDPMVTEVAADGSAGTGAARLYSTVAAQVSVSQTVATIGNYYEVGVDVTARVAGRLDFSSTANSPSVSAVRAARTIGRATNTQQFFQTGGTGTRDLVLDSATVKQITPGTAQTVPSADMDVYQLFTPPASPVQGDQFWLFGRISSFASGNFWVAIYDYSTSLQWNATLYSYASHARTSRASAANIGSANAIRFYANGDTLRMYTSADAGVNWTQRGTDVTNSLYNTAVDVNAIWSSGFTAGLASYRAAA